jgi:hypothetical protein
MFRKCILPPSSGLTFKGQGSGLVIEAGRKEDERADTWKEQREINPLRGSGTAGVPT